MIIRTNAKSGAKLGVQIITPVMTSGCMAWILAEQINLCFGHSKWQCRMSCEDYSTRQEVRRTVVKWSWKNQLSESKGVLDWLLEVG